VLLGEATRSKVHGPETRPVKAFSASEVQIRNELVALADEEQQGVF
jgi:hypothetical protein